jgi:hypothetical protein
VERRYLGQSKSIPGIYLEGMHEVTEASVTISCDRRIIIQDRSVKVDWREPFGDRGTDERIMLKVS